jgi:hypothetical protein
VEESATDSVGAGDVGAPASLGSFAPQKEKQGKKIHLDDLALKEPIGMSGLMEGAAGAVGEDSP